MKISKLPNNINNTRNIIDREEDKLSLKKKRIININEDISQIADNRSLIKLNSHLKNQNKSILIQERTMKKYKLKEKNRYLEEFENDKDFDIENFEFSKLGEEYNIIGRGAYSEVYLAKNKIDEKYYAIKKIKKYKKKSNQNKNCKDNCPTIPSEIMIHRRIIHENILRTYSHHEDKDFIYLVTEYIKNGNLYMKILQTGGLDEFEAYKYFKQVVKAVEFLHENNLVHRDIKPENILLTKLDKIKLCDFGCCVDIKTGFRETFCGTFEYMAPEMIRELPYNQGVDIWSLGILLYEMIHGFSPFGNKNSENQRDLSEIFRNILINKLNFKEGLSESCKDLIKRLLQTNNQQRIKTFEIKNHDWFIINGNNEAGLDKNKFIENHSMSIDIRKDFNSVDISQKIQKINNDVLLKKEKLSNETPLEENKIESKKGNLIKNENFIKQELTKETSLKILKDNIQQKKNLIEKSIDLTVTLPKLDFQNTNNRNSKDFKKNLPDLNSSLENLDENVNVNLNNYNSESVHKSSNKLSNNKNIQYEDIINFNDNQDGIKSRRQISIFNDEIYEDNLNFLKEGKICSPENPNNYNNNKTEDELFDKVLDNIKYKKKKKGLRKINGNDLESNNKISYGYMMTQTTINSDDISNGRNSEFFRNDPRKVSIEQIKSGLSTQGDTRLSDQNKPNKNLQFRKNSYKDSPIESKQPNEPEIYRENLRKDTFRILEDLDFDQSEKEFSPEKVENLLDSKQSGLDNIDITEINSKDYTMNKSKSYLKSKKGNSNEFMQTFGNVKNNSKDYNTLKLKENLKMNPEHNLIKSPKIINIKNKDNNILILDENKTVAYQNYKLQKMNSNNNDKITRLNKSKVNESNDVYSTPIYNENFSSSFNIKKDNKVFKRKIHQKKKSSISFVVSELGYDANHKDQNEKYDSPKKLNLNKSYEGENDGCKNHENLDRSFIYNYEEYETNVKNQEKTLALLKNAKMKKEINQINIGENKDDFWDKVGNFFDVFKCTTKNK